MRRLALPFALVTLTLVAQRPMQIGDLYRTQRVADPQIAASGARAWQVGTVDMAANRTMTRIWLQKPGEAAKALDLGTGYQSRPRFSPDGQKLSYQADGQIWVLDLTSGEKRQISHLSGDSEGQVWSPDGQYLAFTSVTVPSGNDAENAAYLKRLSETKVSAHHATALMFRHWNEWKDAQQVSHLFVVKADGTSQRDLTPGFTNDVPNFAGLASGDDFAWSPDSRAIAFGSHPEQHKAVSTNGEIFEVSLEGGAPHILSGMNKAMDTQPRYSPDGRYLAWRAQRRPGYESDQWEIWVLDHATHALLKTTHHFHESVGDFAWAQNGNGFDLVFAAEAKGWRELYRWDLKAAAPTQLTHGLTVGEFTIAPDGRSALAKLSTLATPPDLYDIDLASGKATRATHHNKALAQELGTNEAEALWVKGPDGVPVHAWVLKPANFDPAKKYPVAFVIHGGPQGSNGNEWHPRWNGQAFAGAGFFTVMPNPRGSTGFGQTFTDGIRADWNGKVMKDLLATLDGALKKYPSADPKRVVCLGASYGGYATNWLAGHHPERFAAFITHAGIWNLESMQVGSEELWFPTWEFKGWPWQSPENLQRWRAQSPSTGAAKLSKPHLVIHGEQDFRVPAGEAYQLFNTLQVRGIPSELIIFPDECHFVQKPQNSKYWYESVLGWCKRWTK
ncbi:MAG TPA: S9 family peptidase [Holophaga sp.]|nr:S9 family peptidase [Holophaga sp.]